MQNNYELVRLLTEIIDSDINKQTISESMMYHISNNIPVRENVYRIHSGSYLSLFREARRLYRSGDVSFDQDDIFLLETDIGNYGLYEGQLVPLDVPFLTSESEVLFERKKRKKKSKSKRSDVDKKTRGKGVNKPFRSGKESKSKFTVYVRGPKGKIKKLGFGSRELSIKSQSKARVKSFLARHRCDKPGPRWKARWWSCNLHKYAKQLNLKFPHGKW